MFATYDGWKSTPPDDDQPSFDDGEDEPIFTCDCGEPLLPGKSLCRDCFTACETWPAPAGDIDCVDITTAQAHDHEET